MRGSYGFRSEAPPCSLAPTQRTTWSKNIMAHEINLLSPVTIPSGRPRSGFLLGVALSIGLCFALPQGRTGAAGVSDLKAVSAGEVSLLTPVGHGNNWNKGKNYKYNY